MSFGSEKSNLFPVLPSTIKDSRYRSTVHHVFPTIVPLGAYPVSAPSYQSQGWTISSHPEGKVYAHIEAQAGITIVTEARIAEPGVSDQLNVWLHIICNIIAEKQVFIPETSHLFLEIHQDSGTCHYYFADHALRNIFWLHTLDTIGVGLPHSYGQPHYSLQENYWIHVEMFPDTVSRYSAAALNELQVIFLHARADALTSEAPTFPYTGKQIVEFIDLLQHSKDHISSPHVTTYVARLWATIVNHRFIINLGQDHCRLYLDQSISEMPDSKWSLLLTFMSKTVLFGFPDVHRTRFESLWVDQVAYTSPWRKHVSRTIEDLKQKMTWIFTLLGLNVAMMSIPASHAMNKGSLLLCFLGLAISFFLLQEQQNLVDTNATVAAMYLEDRNTSHGFQPIAMVHSLPQTLFAWALLLLAMQGFWMIFSDLSLPLILVTFLPVTAGLVVACVGIWKVVRPRQKVVKDPVLPAPIPL